jgi:hypothetical protein
MGGQGRSKTGRYGLIEEDRLIVDFFHSTTILRRDLWRLSKRIQSMSIIAWIIFGLIPGFVAGALAEHYRKPARVKAGYSK